MINTPIELRIITRDKIAEHIDEIHRLFLQCRWDWPNSDLMIKAFDRSQTLVAGYSEDKLVAFGRTISDNQIYALMVDVMVSPDHRNRGYGKALVNYMTEICREEGLKVVQLLSSKSGRKMYEACGFTVCRETAPGMVKFL